MSVLQAEVDEDVPALPEITSMEEECTEEIVLQPVNGTSEPAFFINPTYYLGSKTPESVVRSLFFSCLC
jgi:hypothetical protein